MTTDAPTPSRGERLQRVLADAGVGSRRACEALIEAGGVEVNGQVVRRLPVFVDPVRDRIRVHGRPLAPGEPQRRLYVMLHKPARVITSSRDEPGLDRRTVLDLVKHPAGARLFAVGRLDFDATGLVLLTNDGELAHRVTHPRYGLAKTYRVVVRGGLSDADLPQLERAVSSPGGRSQRDGRAAPASLHIEQQGEDKTVFQVTLKEGSNRQLRDVLKHLGLPVRKMERTAIGPLRLSGLAPGQWRELTRDEVRALKRAASAPQDGPPRREARPPAGASPAQPGPDGPARGPAQARRRGRGPMRGPPRGRGPARAGGGRGPRRGARP